MGALTHWVCLIFLKKTADVLALRLSVVFQRLVRLGSFPACWRQVDVTTIPKGPPSSSGVGSPRTIYGMQWCASNHRVCLSERSGYL